MWIPATSAIRRTPNTTHGSAPGHVVGQVTEVGGEVVNCREENYQNYFEIARKNSKLESERENILTSQPPLDLTPIGVKTPDAKTPITDSSSREERARK